MNQSEIQLTQTEGYKTFLIATVIIGFIADLIAITSVLFAIKGQGGLQVLGSNFVIDTWTLLLLWSIALFTYFGYLQLVWERDKENKFYEDNFWRFIPLDLIIMFRSPFLLLPFLFLLILLLIILGAFIGAFILFMLGISVTIALSSFKEENKEDIFGKRMSLKINYYWNAIEKRMDFEIDNKFVIRTKEIADLSIKFNIDPDYLWHILVKYATEHPDIASFGDLCKFTEDDESQTQAKVLYENVLISLRFLDEEEYFIS